MKNFLTLTVFFSLFFYGPFYVLAADCHFMPCEKTYVGIHQIEFQKNRIVIDINEQQFETSAIYADAEGLFFKDWKRQGTCSSGYWECDICHHCTPKWKNFCEVCWN